ncbi:MAG TPA: hypothetical protein DDY98_02405 [Ruminococcaceae bacterium]|nr:hypothetical protein [Oscillospiraceae bacterium]
MAKRKLGMSLIVLIVAATTLVSGTYAWFLVGGFAELFDLGFDVIEASGGIEIQGSAGMACASSDAAATSGWGAYLSRDCFNAGEIIADGGKYAPVSSANGTSFKKVGLEGGYFAAMTPEKGVDYNDFTIKARSTNDQAINATMTIALTGKDADIAALEAARVSVTYGGTTTIYAVNDSGTSAVTGDLPAATVQDSNNNSIIDSSEGSSYISGQATTNMTVAEGDSNKYVVSVPLTNIPANTGSAEIAVRVWIEGNDADCTGEKLSAKHLGVKITFGSQAAE